MRSLTLIGILFLLLGTQDLFSQQDSKELGKCLEMAGKDVIYLKDFSVELPAVEENERAPISKTSIILRKNTTYRFTICDRENSSGEGIIQLFDTRRMVGSSYIPSSGKIYQSFNFKCTKTGPYTIFVSFKDGKKGSALGVMSYVKK